MWWIFLILLLILILMRIFIRRGRRGPQGGRYFRSSYREHWKR